MFLTEKSTSPLAFLHLFPYKNSLPSPSLPFDHDLGARLRSLLPIPNSPFSVPLSWLSSAVDLLALTLGDAAALISDTSLSGSDRAAIAAHLDSGVALLDACNAIDAHIDCLRRRRRLLRFALHLLSSPSSSSPDSLRRTHEAIVELDRSPRHAINDSAGELARSLAPTVTPRGKISAVRRAIYAVEAVSSLVFGAIVAVLGGGEKADLAGIKISGEFLWVEAFNKVSAAVFDDLGEGFTREIEVVEKQRWGWPRCGEAAEKTGVGLGAGADRAEHQASSPAADEGGTSTGCGCGDAAERQRRGWPRRMSRWGRGGRGR